MTFLASLFLAATLILSWDVSEKAAGYKIYQSVDTGLTWTEVADTTETMVTLSDVPDTGLVLFKASAYNQIGESLRSEAGAWYNGDWQPPEKAKRLGID